MKSGRGVQRPQALNPGWAFLKPAPGVLSTPTPLRLDTEPSPQPQALRAPQVDQCVAQTADLSPSPHGGGGSLPLPAPPTAGSRAGAKYDSSRCIGAPHTQALGRRRLQSIFARVNQDTTSNSQNPIKPPLKKKKKAQGHLREAAGAALAGKGEPGGRAPLPPHSCTLPG